MDYKKDFCNWLKEINIENEIDVLEYIELINTKYNKGKDKQDNFFEDAKKFVELQENNELNNFVKEEIESLTIDLDAAVKHSLYYLYEQNKALSLYFIFLKNSDLEKQVTYEKKQVFDFNSTSEGAINKIYYGAPGTGKSYKVNEDYPEFDRITFHPEVTYFDFIGGLRPIQDDDDKSISYEFLPGPFVDKLVSALKNPEHQHGLIIEELNRANTAAVFGDVFQLLDRDDKGLSKYPILNKDISNYIYKETGFTIDKVKIPSNMSIVATMNSADQGVYVLDSAFKRRWQFEYLPINFKNNDLSNVQVAGFNISWEKLGETLNNHLSEILKIDEDKLIGQRFLTREEMQNIDTVSSKLLMYLWDDVVRYNRERVFLETNSFSKLVTLFKTKGLHCFVTGITSRIEGVDISGNETSE